MTPVTLQNLRKTFGRTVAVDGVDLQIAGGELFFLLGPSGCGKTTLLRMIAGFTDPTSGSIRFGDRDVTHLPAEKRNAAMVFQGYALWPHMSVRENVAFGLEVRKIRGEEKTRRVDEALKAAHIFPLADRKPNELSGGQQQRVALARALVVEPTVLLLDEPLSNLDAKLRQQMRRQIKTLCETAGITSVYVTHDQKEALSMADRIAVMNDGKVAQMGEPRTLYTRPRNRFVADFLGATNFLAGEVMGREGGCVVLRTVCGEMRSSSFPPNIPATGNVTCSIRPEAVRLDYSSQAANGGEDDGGEGGGHMPNHFHVHKTRTTYLGELAEYELRVGDTLRLQAYELNPSLMDHGSDAANGVLQASVRCEDVVILED